MVRLGELEQKVMDKFWSTMGSELTVRDVAEQFPDHAYTTLLTIIDRLERKGLVRRIRDGRAFHYSAIASREAYTAALMRDALGAAPDPDAVLVRFAESVTAEEAAGCSATCGWYHGVQERSSSCRGPELMAAAVILALFSAGLFGPAGGWLDRAAGLRRAPRAGIALWQAVGLAGAMSAIAAGLALAVAPLHVGVLPGVVDLMRGALNGHPLHTIGASEAFGLTLAADVAAVLVAGLIITTARTVAARSRHRILLDLVSRRSEVVPNTVILDDPRATAYCLPGSVRGSCSAWACSTFSIPPSSRRWSPTSTATPTSTTPLCCCRSLRWSTCCDGCPTSGGRPARLQGCSKWLQTTIRAPARAGALASALVQMASSTVAPACAFGAASGMVSLRVSRLIERRRTSRGIALLAGGVAAALVMVPLLAVAV